jgi:hypothetical protein
VPVRIHGDQGAGFQMRAAGVQGANDHRADGYREDVLRSVSGADGWPMLDQ